MPLSCEPENPSYFGKSLRALPVHDFLLMLYIKTLSIDQNEQNIEIKYETFIHFLFYFQLY